MRSLYIIWGDRFNLGIPIIDEQHRAIVSTINTYHYFTTTGKVEVALKPTFVTLDQYTKTHFMTEEVRFEQTEYPQAVEHKKLHADLTRKIKEIAVEAVHAKDFDIVLTFLRKWWLGHIRVEDLKDAAHIKERLE